MSDAYLQTEVGRNAVAVRGKHWCKTETNGAESAFFILFFSVCAPLTHTTQQGTHVIHQAMISDREVEVITLGNPLSFFSPPLLPPSQRLGAGSPLLCQPSICFLETTHFIGLTFHDGPARPQTPD